MIEARIRLALRTFALDVDLTFAPGITVVSGPSGSGKTTLLRTIAGLRRVDTGRVAIDGAVVDDGRRFVPAQRRRVGYVPQDGALFPHLDVAANVRYAPRTDGEAAARIIAALDIAPLVRARPRDISGGEARRVALARALAGHPRALLLDEPFAGLDAAARNRARAEIAAAVEQLAVPVILVSHDAADADALGASSVHVVDGRIVRVE